MGYVFEARVIAVRKKKRRDDGWTSGVLGMFWHIPQAGSAAGGVHTLLSFVLYLYHIRDTTVQHLEAPLDKSMECPRVWKMTKAFLALLDITNHALAHPHPSLHG